MKGGSLQGKGVCEVVLFIGVTGQTGGGVIDTNGWDG